MCCLSSLPPFSLEEAQAVLARGSAWPVNRQLSPLTSLTCTLNPGKEV